MLARAVTGQPDSWRFYLFVNLWTVLSYASVRMLLAWVAAAYTWE